MNQIVTKLGLSASVITFFAVIVFALDGIQSRLVSEK